VTVRVAAGSLGWRRALPAPPTARPAVDRTGRQVLTGLGDGSVHALDVDSGDTRWIAGTGGEVRGRPAIVGRTVVLGGYAGHVEALDLDSGTFRWRTRLADWLVCCPVPVGACLLTGADRRVVALDPDTGAIAWVAPLAGRILGGVGQVTSGFVVAGSEAGDLAVLDPVDGRVAASVRLGGPVRASPAVHGNRVAVPAADGELRVFAVEAG
jgi:outer membrane protein assembly factor BamB